MDIDLTTEPLGADPDGCPVYLGDLWPTPREIQDVIDAALDPAMFARAYTDIFTGDDRWRSLDTPAGPTFTWDDGSTYLRRPPFLDALPPEPPPVADITGARVLVKLGDSVTTDHISPAGAIPPDSPAGRYLRGLGVQPSDLNTYASRRGNHDVMARGTFANVRLRNHLVAGTEGGYILHNGSITTVYEAAVANHGPLLVLAGKDYGAGSSRDWAAKGPALLGVRAVLAESFERIHRANLIGMGVLPLQFLDHDNADRLGLTGRETFTISGLTGSPSDTVTVHAGPATFRVSVRLDTPREAEYYRHGGIMPYVARQMLRPR